MRTHGMVKVNCSLSEAFKLCHYPGLTRFGEVIGNGYPSRTYGPLIDVSYYSLGSAWELKGLIIKHGEFGIVVDDNNGINIDNCQFVDDLTAVRIADGNTGNIYLNNVRFTDCDYCMVMTQNQNVSGQNVTASGYSIFCDGAGQVSISGAYQDPDCTLQLAATCEPCGVTLNWTLPPWLSALGSSYINDFRISRCSVSSGTCTPLTSAYAIVTAPNATTFVDTSVTPGMTYCYRITYRHQQTVGMYVAPFSPSACVSGCPSLPTANPQTVQPCAFTSLQITLTGTDNCSDPLTFIKVTNPSHGTLGTITSSSSTSASVTYTPITPPFCGEDSFTFKVQRGGRDSSAATVTISAGDPNPTANCADVITGKNTPITITLSGTDNCNDSLTFAKVTGSGPTPPATLRPITQTDPTHATVVYSPNSTTFVGTDGFNYTASNCRGISSPVPVTINVIQSPNLEVFCGANAIFLQWTVSAEAAMLASEFQIKRATTTGGPYAVIHTSSSAERSFTDTTVTPGVTYCYVVTIRHQDSCSGLFTGVDSNEACESTCSNPCQPAQMSNWIFTDQGIIGPTAPHLSGALRTYNHPSSVPASPWSFQSANQYSLRMSFENDFNCPSLHGPPFNPHNQKGTADATVTLTCLTRVSVTWTGVGEQQQEDYEKMSLFLNGNLVGSAHAPGGGLECAPMAPVISTPAPPQFMDLPPGTHTLRIETETHDALYHFGAFYQFNLSFTPL